METPKVGILHPGNMGIFVAASAKNSGCEVYWVSEGRSHQTRERAEKFDLRDARTLSQLCETCPIIISVCPPHAAEEVADQVLACGFTGLYVDANAISPQRAKGVSERMVAAGVAFVDGGIVGGPAWDSGETWLYLAGEQADTVAGCFAAGPLNAGIVGEEIGKASALKMCYAAWTKGSTALLSAILATADAFDVWENLRVQWDRDWPDFSKRAVNRARRVTAKAWRFAGEMEEISSTFEAAGAPGEFHAGAAILYRRLAQFKDAPELPSLEEVLESIIRAGGDRPEQS
jgi:3-hydroxyisobutyrate dehydrogenase-like beta-hydroxyacid dehydrogenase